MSRSSFVVCSFLRFVCPLGERFPAWASHSWSRPTRPRTFGEYEYCLLLVTLISISTIPTMLPLDNFWTCWTPSICQHVSEKTHANGHTLDLVISNAINHFFNDVKATDPPISDHLAVHSTLHLEKPRRLSLLENYVVSIWLLFEVILEIPFYSSIRMISMWL